MTVAYSARNVIVAHSPGTRPDLLSVAACQSGVAKRVPSEEWFAEGVCVESQIPFVLQIQYALGSTQRTIESPARSKPVVVDCGGCKNDANPIAAAGIPIAMALNATARKQVQCGRCNPGTMAVADQTDRMTAGNR